MRRRQRIDGLAGRSWILPRTMKPARAKRKIGGRGGIANGTVGQTKAPALANPLGSMGSGSYWYAPWAAEPYQSTGVGSNEVALQIPHLANSTGIQRTRFVGGSGSVRMRSLVLRHSA